ncbi:MAG: hypothetical protein O2857_03560 [Planctomycetota bacterium]|nr:hypothetical protein [Planctomycetota bacterium]
MLTFILFMSFGLMVAWFTVDGYNKGVYYGIVRLGTLLTMYILAGPIGSASAGAFKNFETVPAVVRPYFATLIASVVIIIIGSLLSNIVRWQTMNLEEDAPDERVEAVQNARNWGMGLGGIVGVAMSGLLFIILWNIGWVAEEMRKGPSQEIQLLAGDDDGQNAAVSLREVVAEKMITVKKGIEDSPLGGIVKATNPVEIDDYELVRDVLSLTRDPILMQEFRQHPKVREIIAYEPVTKVLYDEEVRQLVQDKNFRGMLKNEKIARLMQDPQLQKMVKDAQLGEVLKEIRESTGRD